MIATGEKAPDFCLAADDGRELLPEGFEGDVGGFVLLSERQHQWLNE